MKNRCLTKWEMWLEGCRSVSLLFDRIIVYYVRSYLCQNYDMYTLTLSLRITNIILPLSTGTIV